MSISMWSNIAINRCFLDYFTALKNRGVRGDNGARGGKNPYASNIFILGNLTPKKLNKLNFYLRALRVLCGLRGFYSTDNTDEHGFLSRTLKKTKYIKTCLPYNYPNPRFSHLHKCDFQ